MKRGISIKKKRLTSFNVVLFSLLTCEFKPTCPHAKRTKQEYFNMFKTAEFVSLGHPDKTADFISEYILDNLIKQDKTVKYAVEVMIKDNNVVLGGEVCTNASLKNLEIWVKDALRQIGYDERYQKIWQNNAVQIDKIKIINLIGCQSAQIFQGVENGGWGDQGVFAGYACQGPSFIPTELFLAKKLNNALYQKYAQLASAENKVIFGGRLGQYKYYDMHIVIAEALKLCKQEL